MELNGHLHAWRLYPQPRSLRCPLNKTVVLFQMKPTRFTLLLSIFISTSLHVSGNYVPIIRRTHCIYATLVFFVLEQVDSFINYTILCHKIVIFKTIHLFQNEKYQCRTDAVSSPDNGHIVARNM